MDHINEFLNFGKSKKDKKSELEILNKESKVLSNEISNRLSILINKLYKIKKIHKDYHFSDEVDEMIDELSDIKEPLKFIKKDFLLGPPEGEEESN